MPRLWGQRLLALVTVASDLASKVDAAMMGRECTCTTSRGASLGDLVQKQLTPRVRRGSLVRMSGRIIRRIQRTMQSTRTVQVICCDGQRKDPRRLQQLPHCKMMTGFHQVLAGYQGHQRPARKMQRTDDIEPTNCAARCGGSPSSRRLRARIWRVARQRCASCSASSRVTFRVKANASTSPPTNCAIIS